MHIVLRRSGIVLSRPLFINDLGSKGRVVGLWNEFGGLNQGFDV
jgi:hypothetical protein